MSYLNKFVFFIFFILMTLKANASFEDKAKGLVERAGKRIKGAKSRVEEKYDQLGDKFKEAKGDFQSIQNYLDRDHTNGIVSDEVTIGPLTMKQINLNDYKRALVVRASDHIICSCEIKLDETRQKAEDTSYFIVFGLKDKGPQTAVGPLAEGERDVNFSLTAPSNRGIYQIRFRLVEAKNAGTALLYRWLDKEGREPSDDSTLGLLIVY